MLHCLAEQLGVQCSTVDWSREEDFPPVAGAAPICQGSGCSVVQSAPGHNPLPRHSLLPMSLRYFAAWATKYFSNQGRSQNQVWSGLAIPKWIKFTDKDINYSNSATNNTISRVSLCSMMGKEAGKNFSSINFLKSSNSASFHLSPDT